MKTPLEPFDGKALTAEQTANLEAPPFDLRAVIAVSSESSSTSSVPASSSSSSSSSPNFRCVTPGISCSGESPRDHKPPETENSNDDPNSFEYRSLDDLLSAAGFLGSGPSDNDDETPLSLSDKFNSDEAFRNDLRSAIRLDVFETTPFYAKLPEKAKTILLLPDSSLEGSWRIPEEAKANDDATEPSSLAAPTIPTPRMKHTTHVLNAALEQHYSENENNNDDKPPFRFSGDDLFRAIGSICGSSASTHWIDIYGVQDRRLNHSWHLDAGQSPQNRKTVLWGFPPENHYEGTGVFSHVVPLREPFDELLLDDGDDDQQNNKNKNDNNDKRIMEPVLFEGTVDDRYVVRPVYAPGRELLVYRDVDVLHSAPDVAYRTSVMRFM